MWIVDSRHKSAWVNIGQRIVFMRISPASKSTTLNFTCSSQRAQQAHLLWRQPRGGQLHRVQDGVGASRLGRRCSRQRGEVFVGHLELGGVVCWLLHHAHWGETRLFDISLFLKKYRSCSFRIPRGHLQHHHRERGSLKGQKELRLDRHCGRETVKPKVALISFWFCQLTPSSLRTVDSAN